MCQSTIDRHKASNTRLPCESFPLGEWEFLHLSEKPFIRHSFNTSFQFPSLCIFYLILQDNKTDNGVTGLWASFIPARRSPVGSVVPPVGITCRPALLDLNKNNLLSPQSSFRRPLRNQPARGRRLTQQWSTSPVLGILIAVY